MEKKSTIISFLLIVVLLIAPFNAYAAKITSSISATNLTVGGKATITVSVDDKNAMIQLDVSNSSNLKVSSNRIVSMENVVKITVDALKVGKGTVTISGFGTADGKTKLNINRTFNINVTAKPAPKPKPPAMDDTEREKIEAEKKLREELAERMKTPLISKIELISNSDRLKGQAVGEIEPESEKFQYTYLLPKNIDKISLKIETIKDDVELEYDEEFALEEGKESLDIIVKAVQDRLEQEFKIKLERPVEESTFVAFHDGQTYKLIEDSLLDKSMNDLGFEKILMNEEEASQGFYYALNGNNYILASGKDNKAFVFLLDDEDKIAREVFLVSNPKNKPSILLDEKLAEDDERLLKTNPYEEQEIEISKLISQIDLGLDFNNRISGWKYGDDFLTHGLSQDGEVDLSYLDKEGNVKFAFAEFDKPLDKYSKLITYGGYGLWILTLLAFLIPKSSSRTRRRGSGPKH